MQHVRNIAAGATALNGSPRSTILRPHAFLKDGFITYDQATYDSAGAFLIGELERLDPTIHQPLVSLTWARDIDLRTDVQMGDTTSSFTQSTFAMNGQPGGGVGINYASAESTTLARPNLDIDKVVNPLALWAAEVAYTVVELEQARKTGRPIDEQQLRALNLKHQMDLDQTVYIGDPTVRATTGLLNGALVTNTGTVANGAQGSPLWANKSPDEILADINAILTSVWAATGYSVPPRKLLIAPVPFGYISTAKVSESGNETILSYVKSRNILTADTGAELAMNACKWLDKANINGPGAAPAAYDSLLAYSQDQNYVRFPMVPLVPMAPQYQGIWIKVPYYGRLGVVEWVYPETAGIRTGIN